MINFGVREVAMSTVPDRPGWAYVPDTGLNASVTALQPTSRKRHRTELVGDNSAKQDAKLLRDLAALDRESHRDVSIPVPVRNRDNAGRVSHGKVTPAVRKILQSQKTFGNYLGDFEAHVAAGTQPVSLPPAPNAPRLAPIPASATPFKRSHKKKDPNAPPKEPLRKSSMPVLKAESSHLPIQNSVGEEKLADALDPPPHPRDKDPLLRSWIPSIPTQEEIMKLLTAPPLSYNKAKGNWTEDDRRKPVRQFCEVCGYWGRVKCMRCGGRVCALECLNTHKEECFTRYGA
ncbi:hypothetical protein BJ878DRAFT_531615 [Calycina marina]|uniref:HIT-type domain-containing protein n=1 Tax=Calycina marina TaxID=1763456 RepID=A0A9P7ZB59_9HELO|nr:hypothetical protein BJ878DRAFT_531615 [Calycina marina]